MSFKSYALSHQGYYREANEDAYLLQDSLGLYIVADGIGSMKESSIASDLIVHPFSAELARQSFINRVNAIKRELLFRHEFLYNQAAKMGHTIGATIAVLIVGQGQIALLWAGDSRIYGYFPKADRLVQLTEDHVQGSAITRAVGVEKQLSISEKIMILHGGERFLLCTDGLYKKVVHEDIEQILKQEQGFIACQKLIDLSLRHASKDNITVMVVEA